MNSSDHENNICIVYVSGKQVPKLRNARIVVRPFEVLPNSRPTLKLVSGVEQVSRKAENEFEKGNHEYLIVCHWLII
jgi:hypothetical protein